jgi:hypothetical protein
MPLPIRRALVALAGAATFAGAAPAVASACTLSTGPVSKVFAKYADYANYMLAPNGIFANGTNGWSLSGASLVSGGPGLVSGDGHSVVIQQGGNLTSPTFCIGVSTPTVRLMVRQPDGGASTMYVYALWKDWSGQSQTTYIGWIAGSTSWAPSQPLNVASVPLWETGTTLSMRIELVPQTGSNWSVDDVFIDPYSRG